MGWKVKGLLHTTISSSSQWLDLSSIVDTSTKTTNTTRYMSISHPNCRLIADCNHVMQCITLVDGCFILFAAHNPAPVKETFTCYMHTFRGEHFYSNVHQYRLKKVQFSPLYTCNGSVKWKKWDLGKEDFSPLVPFSSSSLLTHMVAVTLGISVVHIYPDRIAIWNHTRLP